MSFARLTGLVLSVADGEASTTYTTIGDSGRAVDGTLIGTVRATKRSWTLQATPDTKVKADALLGLLKGIGDVWHFDEATGNNWQWSVNGRSATSGVANGSSLASGKFSRGLRISATNQVAWTTNTGAVWTVMVWYYTGGAWHHYIVRSDSAKWVDGVRNDGASTPFITHTSTTTTLGDVGSGGNQDFDDLVVFGFLISTTMAETFGVATSAFSDFPTLTLTGDLVNSASVSVRCVADATQDALQAAYSGTFSVGAVLSFTLEEV